MVSCLLVELSSLLELPLLCLGLSSCWAGCLHQALTQIVPQFTSLFSFCGLTFLESLFFSSIGGTKESGGCCWWCFGGCMLEMVLARGTGDSDKCGAGAAVMTLLGIFNPAHCATL